MAINPTNQVAVAIKSGNSAINKAANIICLAAAPGNSNYDTGKFRNAHYQVPTGFDLIITRSTHWGTAGSGTMELGYGDTAVTNSSTPPTNYLPVTGNYGVPALTTPSPSINVLAKIPAGKYPCLRATSAMSLNGSLEGFLVPTSES